MAEVARCNTCSIKHIRSNLRCFGTTKAPRNGGGHPRSITHPILEPLSEHLLERPDQYIDDMAVFLWDEFEVLPALSTISRALKSMGWSKKTSRRMAKGHKRRSFRLLLAQSVILSRLYPHLRGISVDSVIRSCLHIPRMAFFSPEYSKERLTVPSLRTLSNTTSPLW